MQPRGGQDTGLDQRMNGLQGCGARADLVGKRRQAEIPSRA